MFSKPGRMLAIAFHDAVENADDAMKRLVDFNSSHASRRIASIQAVRAHASLVGAISSCFSVTLALLATLPAFRALRRHARLAAERDQLLRARAGEMEAFAYRVAHDLRNPLATLSLVILAAERNDMHPAATSANVSVQLERTAERHRVACTAGVLDSIAGNLLNNAIEHSDDGSRKTRRVILRALPRGTRLRVEIEASGFELPIARADPAPELRTHAQRPLRVVNGS